MYTYLSICMSMYGIRLLFVHVPLSETMVYQTFGFDHTRASQVQVVVADMAEMDSMRKYKMNLPVGE